MSVLRRFALRRKKEEWRSRESLELKGNLVESRSTARLAWGVTLSDTTSPRWVSHLPKCERTTLTRVTSRGHTASRLNGRAGKATSTKLQRKQ